MTQPAVPRGALMVAGIVTGLAIERVWALASPLEAAVLTGLFLASAVFLTTLERVEP